METMPAIRTFAKPGNDTVTVRIPKEYRSYSLEILVVPVFSQGSNPMPTWAGLCEDAVTKNADGPHDMDAIRESILSAERLQPLWRRQGDCSALIPRKGIAL